MAHKKIIKMIKTKMNKITIPIKGMHCRSCEILIEEKLKEIPGIKNVRVNYKNKQADIYSKHTISNKAIENAVTEAGYEVGLDEGKSILTKDISIYQDFLNALAIVLFFYLIAKLTGLTNISAGSTNNPSSLLVVLLIGLTAGLSTCMALVGGLVLSIAARHADKHPEATALQNFRPHLFFNIGRMVSYFVLGGVIGLAGKAFQLSGPTLGAMTIAVGLLMLILGLQLTEISPRVSGISLTLPPALGKFLGIKRHEKEYSHRNSILMGALTFFLPCGFTQAMQLYAISTGSFLSGALIMGIFAIGTTPGLLGIGGLTSIIKGNFAKKFFRFVGAIVLLLAVFNISNGYNLTGWKGLAFRGNDKKYTAADLNVTVEDGYQVAKMKQLAGGYKPNQFVVQKGMPVKWVIDSVKPDSCAGSIMMPEYNIKKLLEPGENVIEFTPTKTGEVKFSCTMGMYSGKFIVVEKQANLIPQNNAAQEETSKKEETKAVEPSPKQEEVATPAPTSENQIPAPKVEAKPADEVQVIKTTYQSLEKDISPNTFTVKANKPVRFEITSLVDGLGCMSTIVIPGVIDEPVLLRRDKPIIWEFTPKETGTYDITCAMGVPRGVFFVE